MLKLLQPGIEPLGQFDLEDDDLTVVRGGEVALFADLDVTDAYAADVGDVGPTVYLQLDAPAAAEVLYGLVDEGTTDGSPNNTNYGTSFGTVIGVTAGQATGLGTQAGRAVVVGPATTLGSGKATLWTKPGLYGVTEDGFADSADFAADAATVNEAIEALARGALVANRGKLASATAATGAGYTVCLSVGPVIDPSLVSTTTAAVGDAETTEHLALYLVGVR